MFGLEYDGEIFTLDYVRPIFYVYLNLKLCRRYHGFRLFKIVLFASVENTSHFLAGLNCTEIHYLDKGMVKCMLI